MPQIKCAGCMKFMKELFGIKCSSLGCDKHFCTQCVKSTSFTPERKKHWVCPVCSANQRKGDNSLTPVRGTTPENVTGPSDPEPTEPSVHEVMKQLSNLTSKFSAIVEKLEDVSQSLSYNNDKLDEMMSKLKDADERLRSLEKRDKEVEILQASVMQLQSELNTQAQYNLRNEVEIAGIPENISENLCHTVLLAAKKVGVELADTDLDWVSRVGPRRPPVTTTLPEDSVTIPRPVVVRLLRRSKRDTLLRATKTRKNLTSADLDVPGNPRKVFFNERLTKENRVLFRDARQRSKQLGYSFCWCSQGTIYVRQQEGKAALLIRSSKELDRLLPTQSELASSATSSRI